MYFLIINYKNHISKILLVSVFSLFTYNLIVFFTLTPYQYTYLNILNGKSELKYKNNFTGNCKFSDISVFSFHPVKNLAMPTGGLIALNHPRAKMYKKKIQVKRWCGITNRKDDSYQVKEIGDNYYMNEISAAIGIKQLEKLNKMNSTRKKMAKQHFSGIEIEHKMPFEKECSYHLYWICVKNREHFRKKLYENGIQTGTHYRPIHTFALYQNQTKLPFTEIVGKQIVTIPIHPNITENQIDKIISLTNKFTK